MEIDLSKQPQPPLPAAFASIPEDTLIFILQQFDYVVRKPRDRRGEALDVFAFENKKAQVWLRDPCLMKNRESLRSSVSGVPAGRARVDSGGPGAWRAALR